MTNKEHVLSLPPEPWDDGPPTWTEDIAQLRAIVPECAELTDKQIEILYGTFSDEEHFATWLNGGFREGVRPFASGFVRWLSEPRRHNP